MGGVLRVRKFTGYAFIDFATADQADHARIALNNTKLDGAIISVSWARYTPDREFPQKPNRTRKNGRAVENGRAGANSFAFSIPPNAGYGHIATHVSPSAIIESQVSECRFYTCCFLGSPTNRILEHLGNFNNFITRWFSKNNSVLSFVPWNRRVVTFSTEDVKLFNDSWLLIWPLVINLC